MEARLIRARYTQPIIRSELRCTWPHLHVGGKVPRRFRSHRSSDIVRICPDGRLTTMKSRGSLALITVSFHDFQRTPPG